jgi:beta-aspartyl-peptidase (threonine type)
VLHFCFFSALSVASVLNSFPSSFFSPAWTNLNPFAILVAMKPSLIVHGGAWDIPDEAMDACNSGCRLALSAGWSVLARGGSALDAVEAAIVVLEDEPVFDAGYGSHLNLDGRVECDAIVMDGATLRAGSVATLQRIKNPIRLARVVLEKCPHMMLVADGAERFAQQHGIALCAPEDLVADSERQAWQRCRVDKHAAAHHRGHEQGTVGAVAMDQHGKLFAATSTGGTCCKLPGRVGDSPLIGCGCYADALAGGVSCTGYGEAIMKVVMAKTAADLLRSFLDASVGAGPLSRAGSRDVPPVAYPSPADAAMLAARSSVDLLADRTHGTGGLILLDRHGHPGFAFNTPRMAFGYVTPDGSFVTAV